MGLIYGTIRIKKDNLYLEKKIYKFSNNLNLPPPKLDRQKDGGIVYIYNINDIHEYEFAKLKLKVAYWKNLKLARERAELNEAEESGILQDIGDILNE
jgi:hypothetical protein